MASIIPPKTKRPSSSLSSSSSLPAKEMTKKSPKPTKTPVENLSNSKKKPKDKLTSDKNLIDDLFGKAKEKKQKIDEAERVEKEKEEAQLKHERARKRVDGMSEEEYYAGKDHGNPKIHRWDQESGLPVYKYYDLGIGKPKSGFTPQCPFDCDCCY
jgi:hypothetical protein